MSEKGDYVGVDSVAVRVGTWSTCQIGGGGEDREMDFRTLQRRMPEGLNVGDNLVRCLRLIESH
jgi:hypothetical protein